MEDATHVWIISKVGGGFVCGGSRRGALPAGDVNSVEVLGHLRQHRWLEASICEASIPVLPLISAVYNGRKRWACRETTPYDVP